MHYWKKVGLETRSILALQSELFIQSSDISCCGAGRDFNQEIEQEIFSILQIQLLVAVA